MITPEAAPAKAPPSRPSGTARDLARLKRLPHRIAPALHSKTRPGARPAATSSTTALIVRRRPGCLRPASGSPGHLTGSARLAPRAATSALPGKCQRRSRCRCRGALGGTLTVTGTVVSVSADSITIQLASGSTETSATGSSTTYHTRSPARARISRSVRRSRCRPRAAPTQPRTPVRAERQRQPGYADHPDGDDVTITS